MNCFGEAVEEDCILGNQTDFEEEGDKILDYTLEEEDIADTVVAFEVDAYEKD